MMLKLQKLLVLFKHSKSTQMKQSYHCLWVLRQQSAVVAYNLRHNSFRKCRYKLILSDFLQFLLHKTYILFNSYYNTTSYLARTFRTSSSSDSVIHSCFPFITTFSAFPPYFFCNSRHDV